MMVTKRGMTRATMTVWQYDGMTVSMTRDTRQVICRVCKRVKVLGMCLCTYCDSGYDDAEWWHDTY